MYKIFNTIDLNKNNKKRRVWYFGKYLGKYARKPSDIFVVNLEHVLRFFQFLRSLLIPVEKSTAPIKVEREIELHNKFQAEVAEAQEIKKVNLQYEVMDIGFTFDFKYVIMVILRFHYVFRADILSFGSLLLMPFRTALGLLLNNLVSITPQIVVPQNSPNPVSAQTNPEPTPLTNSPQIQNLTAENEDQIQIKRQVQFNEQFLSILKPQAQSSSGGASRAIKVAVEVKKPAKQMGNLNK